MDTEKVMLYASLAACLALSAIPASLLVSWAISALRNRRADEHPRR